MPAAPLDVERCLTRPKRDPIEISAALEQVLGDPKTSPRQAFQNQPPATLHPVDNAPHQAQRGGMPRLDPCAALCQVPGRPPLSASQDGCLRAFAGMTPVAMATATACVKFTQLNLWRAVSRYPFTLANDRFRSPAMS